MSAISPTFGAYIIRIDSTIVVNVVGSPYMRAALNPASDEWNKADFIAVVKKDSGNGTIVEIDPLDPLAAGFHLTSNTAIELAQDQKTLTLQAVTNNPFTEADVNYFGTAKPAIKTDANVPFHVSIAKRYAFAVNVNFCDQPAPLRTLRRDEDGTENSFFDGPATQPKARNDYATFLQNQTVPYWRQAAINLYFTADPGTTSLVMMMHQTRGFYIGTPTGNGVYRNSVAIATMRTNPKVSKSKINVFLVSKLVYKAGGAYWANNPGVTDSYMDGQDPVTNVYLSDERFDITTNSWVPAEAIVLAHEIGHSLSLDDSDQAKLPFQILNNLTDVYPAAEAVTYMLMCNEITVLYAPNPARPELPRIGLITAGEASAARFFGRRKSGWVFQPGTDQD